MDPVVFMKLMLVGYLENINSDRRIIKAAQMRLDILYFLGYNIDEELPWHSTLSRTRQLYGEEVFREVFRSILKQCIEVGMVCGKRQAVDSVFVKANASLNKMLEREVMQDVVAFAAEIDRNVEEDSKSKFPLNSSVTSTNNRGKAKPSNKTHYSPSDPDARMSVKPGKTTALNYLGQVGVDTDLHVITHIQAFKADRSDSQCLPEVLKGLLNNLEGLALEEIVADKGYSSGEALKALEQHNIEGYIPNRGMVVNERPGFLYHKEDDFYTCPNNEKLVFKGIFETSPGAFNKKYKVSKKICNVCPLKSQCSILYKNGAVISDTVDKEYYNKMHQRMQTNKAAYLMKKRQSTVEPVIGTLVNYLGMKRVNTKGLKQANKCLLLSAAAYNIKKLLKHTTLLLQTSEMQLENVVNKAFASLVALPLSIFCSLRIDLRLLLSQKTL